MTITTTMRRTKATIRFGRGRCPCPLTRMSKTTTAAASGCAPDPKSTKVHHLSLSQQRGHCCDGNFLLLLHILFLVFVVVVLVVVAGWDSLLLEQPAQLSTSFPTNSNNTIRFLSFGLDRFRLYYLISIMIYGLCFPVCM